MIALFERGELLRAAQEEIANLRQQLAAVLSQVAALSTQLAIEAERATQADAEARLLRERVGALETAAARQAATIEAQTGMLDAHASSLDALRERSESNEEAVDQGRGALARIEKQIEADLTELRRFDTTVAAAMLRNRDGGLPGSGRQGGSEAS